MDFAEIDRPVFFTDGLEHLDRNNLVELLGYVAIILDANLDAIRQAGIGNALPCVGRLLI